MISIDPGKNAAGIAEWAGPKLIRAYYAPRNEWHRLRCDTAIWVERQYLTKDHPRPGDIVELAYAAGLCAGLSTSTGGTITEVLPIRWKGNVPKPIMTKRILSKLDQTELAAIERVGYKDHNTIDAIGIGLYALGRL